MGSRMKYKINDTVEFKAGSLSYGKIVDYEEESNISSISNESIESGLMEFYYISKNYYFSFFFILLIWILYFTINNESLMFYTTTLYPDCKDVRNQVWRLITNCLVHSNLNHILVNSFFFTSIFNYK